MAPPSQPAASGTPRRQRRWLRRLLVISALLAALLGAAYYAATRGPVPAWIVARIATSATGCEYFAQSTTLVGGDLIIENLSLRVPGIQGPAGEVAAAAFVRVTLDWSDWASGDVHATGVLVTKPLLRLSQSPTGELNLARARPSPSAPALAPSTPISAGGRPKPIGLPHIRAEEGLIELGEHDRSGAWRALVRLPVEGGVTPVAGTTDRYAIRLAELKPPSSAPDAGVRIEGLYDAARGEARAKLSGLALDQWTPETVPLAVRRAWRDLALDGRISGAEIAYTPATGVQARVELAGIAMSLPVPTDKALADAPRVRVTSVTGFVALTQGAGVAATGGLEAAISGVIEDLPCQINLRTSGLDPDTANIECEVLSEGFDMRKTWALRPFAPPLVVERIEQFSGPTAKVDARTKVRRVDGRWSYAGSVIFENGRAAFEHFPYPFVDIAGRVEFDDERVRIVGITGRGLTGARLVATGEIKPPDEATFVNIHVDVRDAPIDSVLAAAIDRRTLLAREALWTPTREQLHAFAAAPPMPERPGHTAFDRLLGPERYRELLGNERSWRMGLFQALFCQPEHERLAAAGLVLAPARRAELQRERAALMARDQAAQDADRPAIAARLTQIERLLAAPDFTFGGTIDTLSVDVRYAPDTHRHYDTDITINFREAGLVPEPFPFPVRASTLVVKVRDEYMEFEGAGFKGLRGGEASIAGRLDITDPERTAKVPRMTITAKDVPVDELVISAVPEHLDADPARPADAVTAPRILRALNLTGTVDCTANVWQRDDGEPGYDILVSLADLESRPVDSAGENRVALSRVTGSLRVTHEYLDIPGIAATIGPADCPPDKEPTTGQASFAARLDLADQPGRPAGALAARVGAQGVDLAWPIEDVVAAASPRAAATLADLRAQHQPSGRVDAIVTLGPSRVPRAPHAALHIAADVSSARDLSFLLLGGRVGFDQEAGSVGVRIDEGAASASPPRPSTSIAFSGAAGTVTFDARPAGHFAATGAVALDRDSRLLPLEPLVLDIRDGTLETGLARRVLASAMGPAVGNWLVAHDVAGLYHADLLLQPAPPDAADASRWAVSGRVSPTSLALTRGGVRASASPVSGTIELDGPIARLRDLSLATPEWSAQVVGEFRTGAAVRRATPPGQPATPPRSPWEFEASITADASGFPASLAAVLPEGVMTGAAAISLASSQTAPRTDAPAGAPPPPPAGFRLSRGELYLAGRDGTPDWYSRADFKGELAFSSVGADVGVAITEASGTALIDVRQPDGRPFPAVRLDLAFPSLRAAALAITDASCVVTSGALDGEWLLPVISGRSSGGTIAGSAFVKPPGPAATGREYALRIEAAGVRLADLLADLDPARAASPPGTPPLERGLLAANLAVAGRTSDLPSRRGAGSIVIAGGDVVGVPLMAPMLELSNLIPPVGDKLNYLQGQFFLRGPTLTFEDIRLQSSTVEVVGGGTLSTPDLALNLRFNSRGRARLPIWSDILEGLRDEVLTTTVTGTLKEPKFGSESLSGTRRLLSGIFGDRPPTPAALPNPTEQAAAPAE